MVTRKRTNTRVRLNIYSGKIKQGRYIHKESIKNRRPFNKSSVVYGWSSFKWKSESGDAQDWLRASGGGQEVWK